MTTPTDPDLDVLLARLAEGDRSAFSAVFQRLWAPALRLCRGMLENDADASDAAQLAMEKIFIRADYDPGRPALAWALAIAAWECRTLLRQRFRRREDPGEAPLGEIGEGGEESFVQRELTGLALEALGELSEIDRETLIATFWEEAASVQGATLRKRRERALGRLRLTLRKLYGL